MRTTTKKIALFIWIMALSLIIVNATTLSDTVSDFTGSLMVNQDSTAIALNVDYDGGGSNSVTVIQSDASNTGKSLYVDKNGDGYSIYVDSEATTKDLLWLDGTLLTTGRAINAYSNNPDHDSNELVKFTIDDISAGAIVQHIKNDGSGHSLYIDQNGAGTGIYMDQASNSRSIHIDSKATTTSNFFLTSDNTDANIVTIENNGNHADATDSALIVTQNHASSIANVGKFTNAGTGNGLFIDQNGDGYALNIDSEATSNSKFALYIDSDQGGRVFRTESAGALFQMGNDVDTQALYLSQTNNVNAFEIDNTGTGNGLLIDQNGNGHALQISNDGTEHGLFIDTNTARGASRYALYVDDEDTNARGSVKIDTTTGAGITVQNAGTGNGLYIDQNGNGVALNINTLATSNPAINIDSISTSGNLIDVQNSVGASATVIMSLDQDDATSTGNVLNLKQDGTGNGLLIDQNGEGVALNIDSEATSGVNYGMYLTTEIGVTGALIREEANNQYVALNRGNNVTIATNWFYRNYASGTTDSPVMFIEQDNAGDDQNALQIQQDGTGHALNIDSNNNGIGVYIDQGGNAPALHISNSGNQASIKMTTHGAGIQMESPDGTIYCLTIANGGTTSVSAGTCSA